MSANQSFDCLVIGGGPAGLAAATALAGQGFGVAIARPVAASGPAPDTRTAALFPPVIRMLRRLGAWDGLAAYSEPLKGIRIVDQTRNLLRAPAVTFHASDANLADLGCNVPNAALLTVLENAANRAGACFLNDGVAAKIDTDFDLATAVMAGGSRVDARLVVGADGRESLSRTAAGIDVRRWSYEQHALAATFRHSRPHRGISTELHRQMGPCTCVPLPGHSSSLVWVDRPEVVGRLTAASVDDFLAELQGHFGDLLGELSDAGPRRSFPLTGLAAARMGRNRIALVGESAHLLPPIGAQGLNLGMFDVAALTDLVVQARRRGTDIGADAVLQSYHDARTSDMTLRQGAVDLLNNALTAGLLPVDLLRGAGLHVLAASPTLRRHLIERGLAPNGHLPSLMSADDHPGALEPVRAQA